VVVRGEWAIDTVQSVKLGTPVAVKQWTSAQFSDGDARGEWVMGRLTGGNDAMVRTLGTWEQPTLGMALELLDGATAVGGPPSFESVTRDTFIEGKHEKLLPAQAVAVALQVAHACNWLHTRGICHGDVYLHNTLRVTSGESAGTIRLSDLGAACTYDRLRDAVLERIEVRSFGFLVQDLLKWIQLTDEIGNQQLVRLREVAESCEAEKVEELPTFDAITSSLHAIESIAL